MMRKRGTAKGAGQSAEKGKEGRGRREKGNEKGEKG